MDNKRAIGSKMRPAFGTVDAIIGVAIILGIVLISYFVQSKNKVPADIREVSMKLSTVIQGVENAKTEYNNGMFVASDKQSIPDIDKLKLALGGEKGAASLGAWNYECAAGNDSTITIETNPIPDEDVRTGVVESINSKYSYWVAGDSGDNTVIVTRENSVCN